MKIFLKILVVGVVILGLILPFLNLRAEDPQTAKSEILGEITGLVGELKNLKTVFTLSDAEKDRQETALRLQALLKITSFSLLEITDLRNQLENLKIETDEQAELKNQLLEMLDNFQNYYEMLKKELTGALGPNDLKLLTKGVQAWRNDVYLKNLPLISDFILIFNTKNVLRIADARLEKITADLDKLDSSKLINKLDFQSLLKAASLNLNNAHLLIKRAEDLLFLIASNTISIETADLKIKYLAQSALKETKSAYKIFIEISTKIRQFIGLQ